MAGIHEEQASILEDQAITVKDVLRYQSSTALIIRRCTSTQWFQIGEALASHQHLLELSIVDCSCGDAILLKLEETKQLLRLRVRTLMADAERCGITPSGV